MDILIVLVVASCVFGIASGDDAPSYAKNHPEPYNLKDLAWISVRLTRSVALDSNAPQGPQAWI